MYLCVGPTGGAFRAVGSGISSTQITPIYIYPNLNIGFSWFIWKKAVFHEFFFSKMHDFEKGVSMNPKPKHCIFVLLEISIENETKHTPPKT